MITSHLKEHTCSNWCPLLKEHWSWRNDTIGKVLTMKNPENLSSDFQCQCRSQACRHIPVNPRNRKQNQVDSRVPGQLVWWKWWYSGSGRDPFSKRKISSGEAVEENIRMSNLTSTHEYTHSPPLQLLPPTPTHVNAVHRWLIYNLLVYTEMMWIH